MRRFFWGLAIASLTVSAPVTAFCGDREIAESIIANIKDHQSKGTLKGFDIDLNVESGVVTLSGAVSNKEQAIAVLGAAYGTPGVVDVVDNITVRSAKVPTNLPSTLATAAFGGQSRKDVRQVSNVEGEDNVPLTLTSEDLPATTVATEPPKMQISNGAPSEHDSAITDEALGMLSKAKSAGTLRQFDLDLSTVDGEVWVKGTVASSQQKQLVLSTVQHVRGVKKVIDDLKVAEPKSTKVQPASTTSLVEPSQHGSMPVVGAPSGGPRPFAPSTVTNYQEGLVSSAPIPGIPIASPQGGGATGMQSPVPMNMGQSYGAGVPRYDQPQMPGYAWPSYAAYPNYSAVTYPKQYSASAWPYIGPFYPYPQVPLGWRRVALEWDDGLWYLDFTSK